MSASHGHATNMSGLAQASQGSLGQQVGYSVPPSVHLGSLLSAAQQQAVQSNNVAQEAIYNPPDTKILIKGLKNKYRSMAHDISRIQARKDEITAQGARWEEEAELIYRMIKVCEPEFDAELVHES